MVVMANFCYRYGASAVLLFGIERGLRALFTLAGRHTDRFLHQSLDVATGDVVLSGIVIVVVVVATMMLISDRDLAGRWGLALPGMGSVEDAGAENGARRIGRPLEERSLTDLGEARGNTGEQFCMNEACHAESREELEQLTSDMGSINPHKAQHGEMDCGYCHKAHRASVMQCAWLPRGRPGARRLGDAAAGRGTWATRTTPTWASRPCSHLVGSGTTSHHEKRSQSPFLILARALGFPGALIVCGEKR